MIQLGLIGYPLDHSLSPRLHTAAFREAGLEGEYRLYPVAPKDRQGLGDLCGHIRTGDLNGLNITIPHKQTILPFLDDCSPSARVIGAVNTIFMKGNRLVGENTYAPGFMTDLFRSFPDGFRSKKAIVLGAGGAARAVAYALISHGWTISLAVRQSDIKQADELLTDLSNHTPFNERDIVLLDTISMREILDGTALIVNTTPVGMYPASEATPWPEGLLFPVGAAVYDLVYNPRATVFLRLARAAGLRTASGIGMLVEQAALSFELWTGKRPSRDLLLAEVESL